MQMNPILLQKQIRENNEDLQDYFKDLKSWGDEMKRKESNLKSSDEPTKKKSSLLKNKNAKKSKEETSKKSIPKDYSYWEKLDVEAECDKVDNDVEYQSDSNSSDISDEIDSDLIEKAVEEKEKGNKLVKCNKFQDAIKAYTQAIQYCQTDATFFANRALCHLKLNQYKSAEADCTIALQLDKKYVKALHRRATAREALKQYKEAKCDLEKVLELEPTNKESKILLEKVDNCLKDRGIASDCSVDVQRPISKFTASRQNTRERSVATKSPNILNTDEVAFKDSIIEHRKQESKLEKPLTVTKTKESAEDAVKTEIKKAEVDINLPWPAGNSVNLVNSFTKDPKLRSRVPLKRIVVKDASKSP